jgi:hypothetical protein
MTEGRTPSPEPSAATFNQSPYPNVTCNTCFGRYGYPLEEADEGAPAARKDQADD